MSNARIRGRLSIPLVAAGVIASLVALTGPGAAAQAARPPSPSLRAVLDGRPIPLSRIPDYHCQDVAYPEIRCFRTAAARDASVASTSIQADGATTSGTGSGDEPAGATSVVYVTVYDGTYLSGSSYAMTQDQTVLAFIGWNDRISSLRVLVWGTSRFYVDWFLGGASAGYCCNGTFNTLGSYNNTFSSVDVPN